jgi:adenine-specific DNA-methyltransferase
MKKELGQYFTTNTILLEKLYSFIKNTHGSILEPSIGAGNIIDYIVKQDINTSFRSITGIEIDKSIDMIDDVKKCPNLQIIYQDFLEYTTTTKFSTIVGNPPYVKRKNCRNIYIDFIDRCIDLLDEHGELILIIPSDFFQLTSASSVKKKMIDIGSITHIFHANSETLFKNASQDVLIFRYELGRNTNKCYYNGNEREVIFKKGNIYFIEKDDNNTYVSMSDIFDIKVGMVSGADEVFKTDHYGNIEIRTSNGIRKYLYLESLPEDDDIKEYMLANKTKLLSRRIKTFNENNWYQWGCPRNIRFMEENKGKDCIYATTLTRKLPVFKKGIVEKFDGSVLCLLPKNDKVNIDKVLTYLNSQEFLTTFLFSGRYKIGQKSLSDCNISRICCQAEENMN